MLKKFLKLQLFLTTITLLMLSILPSAGSAQAVEPVILDLNWSPDGTLLAVVSDDGSLNVAFPSQNRNIFQFMRPIDILPKAAVVWSPQGNLLAAGIGNRMYIWEVDSWQLLYEYEVGLPSGFFTWGNVDSIPEGVQTITWSLDARYVVVGTNSYETSVWDTQAGILIYRAGDLSGGGPGRVWLSDDGRMGDGATWLNAFTGERTRPPVEDIPRRFGGSNEGGISEPRPDNIQIAQGTYTGELLIIDLETTWGIVGFPVTPRQVIGGPGSRIMDISWDGTWNFIAVVSHDGELYVANVLTSEVESVLQVDGTLNAVDWNPQTNDVTYAGVSDTGEPLFSTTNVSGIAGVPEISLTPTHTPTETPTLTFTSTRTPSATPNLLFYREFQRNYKTKTPRSY